MISIFCQFLAALVIAALGFPAVSECKAISVNPATVTYDYDAFGILLHSTGTAPNNYLYSGEQFDPDLGLYYNRARYLNVGTGRFWTLDTIKENAFDPRSLHLYVFSNGDPVNGIDPSGTEGELAETNMAQLALVTIAVATALTILARIAHQNRIEIPFRANHYTTWAILPLIIVGGINNPFGRNYLTTDYYLTAKEAKSKLALSKLPDLGINLFVFKYGDGLDGPTEVLPANGEPGGGTEYSTYLAIPFLTRAPIIFPLF